MTTTEIQTRIKEVYGEQVLCDVFSESRKENVGLIRIAIAQHLREDGWKVIDIAAYLNRKHPGVSHYLKTYRNEYETNSRLREIVKNIFEE